MPATGVFQVGHRNRYRHPKAEVVQRYRDMNVRVLRTDQSGALTIDLDGAIAISEYRREHARYWHGR
jgi:competence protein ComEC